MAGRHHRVITDTRAGLQPNAIDPLPTFIAVI
jgi:hypothetical protein